MIELSSLDIIQLYVIALGLLLILDVFWIGILAQEFYKKEMRRVIRRRPAMSAVLASYAVMAFGYVYFAAVPALEQQRFSLAVINGLIFGLCAFGFYSLSSFALIKGWTRRLAVVEIIWGLLTSVIVAGGTFVIYELIFGV